MDESTLKSIIEIGKVLATVNPIVGVVLICIAAAVSIFYIRHRNINRYKSEVKKSNEKVSTNQPREEKTIKDVRDSSDDFLK